MATPQWRHVNVLVSQITGNSTVCLHLIQVSNYKIIGVFPSRKASNAATVSMLWSLMMWNDRVTLPNSHILNVLWTGLEFVNAFMALMTNSVLRNVKCLKMCCFEIYENVDNLCCFKACLITTYPDSKVHGANMGPTWVLAPWTLLSEYVCLICFLHQSA